MINGYQVERARVTWRRAEATMREMHRPGTKGMMSHNDVELPHQRKVAISDPGPVHHQVVVVEPARGLGVPGACNRGNQNRAQNGITTGSGAGGSQSQ